MPLRTRFPAASFELSHYRKFVMSRGGYIGGSSVIRIGPKGTRWARQVEPVTKVRNVAKKWPLSPRALAKSYIFVAAYAQADGVEPPNPPKRIQKEIDAFGGFANWCQADRERRSWLTVARKRAQTRNRRRVRSPSQGLAETF